MVSKEFGINGIHSRKVVHRLQEDLYQKRLKQWATFRIIESMAHCGFRDLAQFRASSLDNCFEVSHNLGSLSLNATFHDLHGRWVERDTSGAK